MAECPGMAALSKRRASSIVARGLSILTKNQPAGAQSPIATVYLMPLASLPHCTKGMVGEPATHLLVSDRYIAIVGIITTLPWPESNDSCRLQLPAAVANIFLSVTEQAGHDDAVSWVLLLCNGKRLDEEYTFCAFPFLFGDSSNCVRHQ